MPLFLAMGIVSSSCCVPSRVEHSAHLCVVSLDVMQEAFNEAAVILDIDGNAWSDRFGHISQYNSPILKQVRPS
jgi:hypothetical protein